MGFIFVVHAFGAQNYKAKVDQFRNSILTKAKEKIFN